MTERGGVAPIAALAFATVAYFAVLIAGFGLLSLLGDVEVLAVPGLGQLPGALGVAAATAAFAAVLWPAVRRPEPGYGVAVVVAAASFLAYLAGVGLGAVIAGADPAQALAAAAGFATSGFAVVLAIAAFAAAWAGVALVRTRAERPRWPWEDDDEDR